MRRIPSFRGLITRLLAFAALLTLATVFGYAGLYRILVVPIRNEYMINLIRQPVDHPRELAECAARPATWVWNQGNAVHAYNSVTGVSQNPDAPPLRRDLVGDGPKARLALEETGGPTTTVAVWRTGQEGECGIMQLRYSASNVVEERVLRIFLAVALGTVPFVGFSVFLAVVRPILTALHRLRHTAMGVGGEGFQHLDPDRRDL